MAVEIAALSRAEVSLQRNDELMPWNLGPVAWWPASLTNVGITEGEPGDDLEVPHPDLVDGVPLLVEILRLDTLNDRELVAHD